MNKKSFSSFGAILICAALLGAFAVTGFSHHSFAMYDMTKTVSLTGVLTRFVSQANHAEIHFVPLGPDGKPERGPDGKYVDWGVEMAGAAAMATQGISVNTFPAGTIFSVNVHPLRDGKNYGTMEGAIVKCPKDTPPPAGKHCNAVQGSTQHGRGSFTTN